MGSVHDFSFGSLSFNDRILVVRFKENLELTEQLLDTVYLEGKKLAGDDPFCILADVRSNASASGSTRKYAANNIHMKDHLAYATLATSTAVIILSNFFINVNKPIVPSRLFKKEEEAMAWLKEFL